MKLKYYFLFFVLSLLASCNDEEGLDLHNKPIESNSIVLSPDEYISIAYDNPRVITPDEAKQLALDFGVNRVQTRGNENIVVKFRSSFNIEEKGSNAVTRSVTDKSILLPVYEMEIVSDAGKGLAYVSADERVAKVMAYLPKVNLEDTAKIIGAKAMLGLSEQSLLEEAKHYEKMKLEFKDETLKRISKELNVAAVNFNEIKDRILVEDCLDSRATPQDPAGNAIGWAGFFCMATNWDQEPVYNDLLEKAYCAPNVGKEPVYKAVPAGCSVVAMAQIMASLEPNLTIDGIKVGIAQVNTMDIDGFAPLKGEMLEYMDNLCVENGFDTAVLLLTDVINATSEVFVAGTHPEYDKTTNWVTGSGTSGPQTRDFLRRYFTTGDLINGWDGNAAFLSLQKAKLVWVGVSDASKKASHAFVIDGFAYWRPQTRYLVKNFDFYFRANMGWAGSYDGFYLVNKDMSISFEAGGYELNTGFNMICDIIL